MQEIEELRKRLLRKTREQVRETFSGKDFHISRAVALLEDLDSVYNLLAEHCREWYAIHFPELGRIVRESEEFLKLVAFIGKRQDFSQETVLPLYSNPEQLKKILDAVKNSVGSEITEKDLEAVQATARNALEIRKQREEISSYIEREMQAIAPNFSSIAGTLLGARMLSKAGSLRKLALLPSSTIQLLGAEKALFRHIKSGARGPKYGYLYAHPALKPLNAQQKGRAARAVAGKLSIAAKKDFFSKKKEDISKELLQELNQRMEEIKKIPFKKKPEKSMSFPREREHGSWKRSRKGKRRR